MIRKPIRRSGSVGQFYTRVKATRKSSAKKLLERVGPVDRRQTCARVRIASSTFSIARSTGTPFSCEPSR